MSERERERVGGRRGKVIDRRRKTKTLGEILNRSNKNSKKNPKKQKKTQKQKTKQNKTAKCAEKRQLCYNTFIYAM